MDLPPFLLDRWIEQKHYPNPRIEYDLASSTGPVWTLRELLALSGEAELEGLLDTPVSYTTAAGSPELRAAIAGMHGVDASEVQVVTGASEALLVLFWAQAALTSVRHVPIFVIVAAPILVAQLTQAWNRWARSKSRNSVVGIFRDLGDEFSAKSLRATIWAPVVILALGVSMATAKGDTWPQDFPKLKFPVALLDRYAGRLAPESGPMPRIFTSDQWGDYLTYRFYPRIRIFVDGRSDLFGPVLGKEYVHVAGGHYEWEQILDRYHIEIALVPIDWPLAELLKRNAGWRLIKDDGLGILFERRTPVLMKSEGSAESSTSTARSLHP